MITISDINELIKKACLDKQSQIIIKENIDDTDIKILKENGFNILKKTTKRVSDGSINVTFRIIW